MQKHSYNELYITVSAMLISAACIYLFNYFITFKKDNKRIRFKMALILPYISILFH